MKRLRVLGLEMQRQYIQEWADLLNQPIPNMKRVSIDIEVESEEGKNTQSSRT